MQNNNEQQELKDEIRSRIGAYIAGGFGLVAGLAWNDAIRSSIEFLFPLDRNTLLAKFIYAFLMTMVLVIISTYVIRIFSGKK